MLSAPGGAMRRFPEMDAFEDIVLCDEDFWKDIFSSDSSETDDPLELGYTTFLMKKKKPYNRQRKAMSSRMLGNESKSKRLSAMDDPDKDTIGVKGGGASDVTAMNNVNNNDNIMLTTSSTSIQQPPPGGAMTVSAAKSKVEDALKRRVTKEVLQKRGIYKTKQEEKKNKQKKEKIGQLALQNIIDKQVQEERKLNNNTNPRMTRHKSLYLAQTRYKCAHCEIIIQDVANLAVDTHCHQCYATPYDKETNNLSLQWLSLQ